MKSKQDNKFSFVVREVTYLKKQCQQIQKFYLEIEQGVVFNILFPFLIYLNIPVVIHGFNNLLRQVILIVLVLAVIIFRIVVIKKFVAKLTSSKSHIGLKSTSLMALSNAGRSRRSMNLGGLALSGEEI